MDAQKAFSKYVSVCPGSEIKFAASGRAVLAAQCSSLPSVGLIRVAVSSPGCGNSSRPTSAPRQLEQRAAASARPHSTPRHRTYDLKWSQPVTGVCMIDLGVVCCGTVTLQANVNERHAQRQAGVVKIFGLFTKPVGKRCPAHQHGRG